MIDEMAKGNARQLAKILNAYADGKTIERFDRVHARWVSMPDMDMYTSTAHNYRIQSEPTYEPYKTSEEFQDAARRHGFWICRKSNKKESFLPVNAGNDSVLLLYQDGNKFILSYMDTMDFVWADDNSPLGRSVMEKQKNRI